MEAGSGKIQSKLIKPFDFTMINNVEDMNHLKNEVQNMKDNRIWAYIAYFNYFHCCNFDSFFIQK